MPAAKPQAAIVNHTSQHTCDGINILTENQRNFIDENIAEHTSCRSRDGAHDDIHPHRETGIETFFHPDDGEKTYTDGIEDEEGVVQTYQLVPEEDNEYQGYCSDYHIRWLVHPEWGYPEQDIPQGTSSDGGHKAHDIGTEDIKILRCGKPDSAYGECECTYIIKNGYKIHGRKIEPAKIEIVFDC